MRHHHRTHRRGRLVQRELFAELSSHRRAPLPAWETLPAGTRRRVTDLLVRMLLDHVDRARQAGSAGRDD